MAVLLVGGFAALLIALSVVVALTARHLAPMARKRVLTALEMQLGSPVQAGGVTTRFERGWRGSIVIDIYGLDAQSVLRGIAGDPAHPMLRVQHLTLRMSPVAALLGRNDVSDAHVPGIAVALPPVPSPGNIAPAKSTMHLERVTIDDAHLTFATGDPARAPLIFDLPHVALTGLGGSGPARFTAVVDAGAPIGLVQTAGTLGPWQVDPRDTPLQGDFAFANRSVDSVRGLRGRLSMKAHYHGTLAEIETEGDTEDPAFGFDAGGHPVLLRTRFAMGIDAVHGITTLRTVDAHFLHTQFRVAGTVIKSPAVPGYVLDLALLVPSGRVEDALTLIAPTQPTLLRGALTLEGRLHMPSGPEPVLRKLQLAGGHFRLSSAEFGDSGAQREADGLSERAKRRPQDATAAKAVHTAAEAAGDVTLAKATLHFSAVRLEAPGIHLSLVGSYALGGSAFAVSGTMHTDARASQMQTGLKRTLTRPFNGLMAHGSNGAVFPLQITGSGNQPHFQVTLPGGKEMKAPGLRP